MCGILKSNKQGSISNENFEVFVIESRQLVYTNANVYAAKGTFYDKCRQYPDMGKDSTIRHIAVRVVILERVTILCIFKSASDEHLTRYS